VTARAQVWFLSALAAMAAGLPACGAGTPTARGFGSHEVLPIRDSTFSFNGGFGPTSIGYSTADDGGISLFTLDLTTDRVQPFSYPDGGITGGNGYDCEFEQSDELMDSDGLMVTNLQTGQETTIDNVTTILSCPTSGSTTLTVLRPDSNGVLTLWSGPVDNLQQIALPIVIAQAVVYGNVFLASFPAQPSALGLFRIDPVTLVVTEIVPPELGTAAWANGANATGSLTSSTLLLSPSTSQSNVAMIGAQYLYERAMSDGSTIMFAGPFPSGPASELALFEVAPSDDVSTFPPIVTSTEPSQRVIPVAAWQYGSAAQGVSLLVWNDSSQQFAACPLPGTIADVGTATADGTKTLFGASIPSDSYEPGSTGPLVLVSFASAGATCTLLAPADTTFAEFSTDGSEVFWLTQPYGDEGTLWTAASDGSGARIIGTGDIEEPRFALGTELEFELGGDLVWVDTNDTSNQLHYVAEQVFGTAIDLGGPWVVTGYDFSTQDATGLLGLVNRDQGTKRLISPEVSTYVSQYTLGVAGLEATLPDGGVPSTEIGYLVRGRNPSSQDGIWVATISETDLQ
jgi:hypothetical protein